MKRRALSSSNEKKVQLIKLLTQIGPEITEIASRIGVHKETVRYWYNQLLLRGFVVQASVNHEKLGLKRVLATVEFGEEFRSYSEPILTSMNELCYVHSYAKTLPDTFYIVQASVPERLVDSWVDFMNALQAQGLFKSLDFADLEWVRNVPMRAELYDFETGMWDYDWSSPKRMDFDSAQEIRGAQEGMKFDYIDLSLLEHLEIDAGKSLTEIAEKLKINYKTVSWHYRTHLLGRRLLKNFRVVWTGTRYEPKLEKAAHRKHSYMWIDVLVMDTTEVENMELSSRMNQLPFIWLEAGGKNYFAEIAIPIESMTEALTFLGDAIAPVKGRARWFIMDQAHALRFTVVPRLYDTEEKKWKFDQAELLARFDKLLLQIRSGAG